MHIYSIEIETGSTGGSFDLGLDAPAPAEHRNERIVGIEVAAFDEDGSPRFTSLTGWRADQDGGELDERIILADFWQMIAPFRADRDGFASAETLYYALPRIVERSIALGVRQTVNFFLFENVGKPARIL